MNNYLRCFLLTGILLIGRMLQVQAQEQSALIKHIKQLQQTVQDRHLTIREIKPGQLYELPTALLNHSAEGRVPVILIDEMTLDSTYAELKAYAVINLPGAKEPLYFATTKSARLNFNNGLLDIARMELVQDSQIIITDDDPYVSMKTAKPYIEFSSYGFNTIGLDAPQVQLSSKPVKKNTDSSPDYQTEPLKVFKVYPNPSSGHFKANIKLSEKADVELQLLSFANNQLIESRQEQNKNEYTLEFDHPELLSGIYILTLSVGKQV